jgi:outer membrane receptor protein involved in Fe transport
MLLITCSGLVVTSTAHAQSTPSVAARAYDIPAGDLAAALNKFSNQSGLQVLFDTALVQGRTAPAVRGTMDAHQALQHLLEGSSLRPVWLNARTVILKQNQPRKKSQASPVASAEGTAAKPTTLEAVAVTGTRIRGGVTASPTITIGAQQIRDEGFSDLGEVTRSVPQNFSGGQNPGVAAGASQGGQSDQNITGGSGMNLRGLGPDATLTLLNGHRMSYEGFAQAVDISAIPIDAVERLEIVPDGASAIYGSDAVGGVANVILKRDFNGVTLGARYGSANGGGLTIREYTATAGTTWTTGGFIAAGEKSSNDPIYADQRGYTQSMYQPSTLWQGSNLRSGLFSLHQSLGDAVELHLDALGNDRNSQEAQAYPGVYYPYNVETKTTMLAPSLEVWLPGDWTLTLSGAVGKEKDSAAQPMVSTTGGAVTDNGLAVDRNKSLTYEIGAEGPLFTLPGGEARLATGVGYRYNKYLSLYSNEIDTDGDESSRFAYAELNLPLVGPEQGIGGIERLELTGAVRTEDGDYGRVTTPKFGVIYDPTADFTLKASWGKSFKVPTLLHQYQTQTAYLYPATMLGGAGYAADASALALCCGNPNLVPERARTSSTSLLFHPEAVPGLEAELTWFHIDYTNRVVLPLGAAIFQALGNPVYAEFVDNDPKASEQAAVLANTVAFYNYTGADYDPSKVVAIVDNRYVNASGQKFKGIDLSGSYGADFAYGHLIIRGSVSWLESKQQLVSTQDFHNLAGTLFNPAKLNGRIGAMWQQGSFTASLFGNYKSGVINTADGRKGASFTTFDATLRYDTGAREDAWSHLALELSAQNLLNRAPPLYAVTSLTYTPYDSTNYSAVGRFVSVSVSKHW